MNPQQLAAKYADFLADMRRDMAMLQEYNLSRYEDDYVYTINALQNLVDGLEQFR